MSLREEAQQALERLEFVDTQDWDELETLRESLREHMAEIHLLRAAGRQALEAMDSKHDMTKAEWRVLHYRAFTDLRAALAEGAMQRLTDVQQEMEATINKTRNHRTYRMLKEAMDSDRENIIRNMPDIEFPTESQKRKPLTENEIDKAWRSVDYRVSYDNFRIEVARAIERAHEIGDEA